MTRILVVEDNPDIALGLRKTLEAEGHHVYVAPDGQSGLERARQAVPDLVLLDLMLPRMDGYRVLRELRDERLEMPVMILTARGDEVDKVRGFRLGADDYLTKPFSMPELTARVEALVRRARLAQDRMRGPVRERFRFGEVVVDTTRHVVTRQGKTVALRPKEHDLLVALLRREGAVAARHELLTEIWGYDSDVMSRTLDAHVAALLRKLEADPARPAHILTVRKTGYRLEP